MSMYAVTNTAINDRAINRPVLEADRSSPTASTPPYLRLVPLPLPGRGRTTPAVFWRRRLAVLLVMAALVMAIKGLAGGAHAAPETTRAGSITPAGAVGGARQEADQEAYVVKQGDTLWAIARRLQPNGDVRPMVDRLAALRRGEPLRVGERILLPRDG